jgi:pyrimidine deaminase RibD-like protein
MRRAVDLAKKSVPESGKIVPCVGAVVVKGDREIAAASRGQCGPGCHAEYCALTSVRDEDLTGATVYTTLEPCSSRNPGKTACAQRLIDRRIGETVIGLYDPNPVIHREGWRMLRDAGVRLRDFPSELRNELRCANLDFLDQFRFLRKESGEAKFDHRQQWKYTVGETSPIVTEWDQAGRGEARARAQPGCVTLARHAKSIAEVDDPSALDFASEKYFVPVKEKEVVVFHDGLGTYAVVKVERVLSRAWGDSRDELAFSFEIRRRAR